MSSIATTEDGCDQRRGVRRPADGVIAVVDCMTDRTLGLLGNVSETGMLLISNVALVDDGLYQLQFQLDSTDSPASLIEVGAHVLWQAPTSNPERTWVGLRFINLPEPYRQRLHGWLARPR
ncbi:MULTISPECIES: PilZ domain-containing protein [unclassified Lysobacter]